MNTKYVTRFLAPVVLTVAIASSVGIANAADIKEHHFKMAMVNPIDHPQGFGCLKFSEAVEKKSGGKIKIKVFASGSLGGDQQVAAAMQGGLVDFASMAPAQIVGTIKEFVVIDFPFSFANEAQADAVLDGPFGKKLMSYLPAKGWVGLGFQEQGFRSITNSKRPINKLEDIKGLKIRTILNPLYIDMINALGANAVPMPFPELYSGLETRTIDGQENPETTADSSKLYEVQKFFSATRHIYNPQLMFASKKTWDSLTPDEQKLIQEAMDEVRAPQRKYGRDMTAKSRQVLIDHGMVFNEIAPQELARIREKVKPVIDKYAAQIDPQVVKEFAAELERVKNLK